MLRSIGTNPDPYGAQRKKHKKVLKVGFILILYFL